MLSDVVPRSEQESPTTDKTTSVIMSSVTDDEFGEFRITIPPKLHWLRSGAALLFSLVLLAIAATGRDVRLFGLTSIANLATGYCLVNTSTRRVMMIDGKNPAIGSEFAGLTQVTLLAPEIRKIHHFLVKVLTTFQ